MFSWDPIFVKLLRFVHSGIEHQKSVKDGCVGQVLLLPSEAPFAWRLKKDLALSDILMTSRQSLHEKTRKHLGSQDWGLLHEEYPGVNGEMLLPGAVDMPKAAAETNATADWREREEGGVGRMDIIIHQPKPDFTAFGLQQICWHQFFTWIDPHG